MQVTLDSHSVCLTDGAAEVVSAFNQGPYPGYVLRNKHKSIS
jgi:hypothetical protein